MEKDPVTGQTVAEALEQIKKDTLNMQQQKKQLNLLHKSLKTRSSLAFWTSEVLGEILDELSLEIVFESHRAMKLRRFQNHTFPLSNNNANGTDVHGQRTEKFATELFKCNNCQQEVVASRFAPHLEKCMGMGRQARPRRNTERRRTPNLDTSSDDEYNDDNDEDYGSKSRRPGRPRTRSPGRGRGAKTVVESKSTGSRLQVPKKKKKSNSKGNQSDNYGDTSGSDEGSSGGSNRRSSSIPAGSTLNDLKCLTAAELNEYFSQSCGVVSNITAKLCTKSLKCPQHSDEQRQIIRNNHLGERGRGATKRNASDRYDSSQSPLNEYVDIDGEEGEFASNLSDSAMLRKTSHSRSGSPLGRKRKKKG